jgi:hypothetical protein
MSHLVKGAGTNTKVPAAGGQSQTPSKQAVAPMALELEKLTLNPPLSPYSLAVRAAESLDHLNGPLTLTLDSFRYGYSPFNRGPATLEMDAIFRREEQPADELSEKNPDDVVIEKPRKSRQPGKAKQPLMVKSLEPGTGELSLRLDKCASLVFDDREETALRKAKSASEPTTEDSASQTEVLSFPGLAGSLPNFKKSVCHCCKQTRLVFWFGDASTKRRGDRYLCTECLKTATGEERFLSFFRIESLWTQPAYADIAEAQPLPPLKDFFNKFEGEKNDHQSVALSFLLEEKKLSVQSALARMTTCLNSCRAKAELETQLFATRFLHDLLEAMIRIGYIGKQRSIEKKLDCLDISEKTFFLPEIKKLAVQVAAFSEGQKGDADLLALNNQLRMPVNGQPPWFSLDFDERHSLGKRDSWTRNRAYYPDVLENDQDAF